MSDIEYLCPIVSTAYKFGNSDAIRDGFRMSSYVKPPPPLPSPFPQVDWKETRDAHIFNVDIPGVKKEAVKLRMADNAIVEISVERRREEENGDEEEKYHCFEHFKGSFARHFRVSEDAKVDDAKASMEGGVLTVIVPKQHDYQPKFKDIEIFNY